MAAPITLTSPDRGSTTSVATGTRAAPHALASGTRAAPDALATGTPCRVRGAAARLRSTVRVTTICAALLAADRLHAADAPTPPPGAAVRWTAADAIDEPLAGLVGDPVRGRAIVADRTLGMCLVCHRGPFPEVRQQGGIATDLAGAGTRWGTAQLRARIVDARRIDPASIMPAFHRSDGLVRVAPAWRDRPMLDAQQVEDVVAYLAGLRDADGAARR